uniref:Uncharacterized protein n=1 Tax=Romanomermis culicivorax TaxID=13658 RepID=A0A915ILX2_ROMCU
MCHLHSAFLAQVKSTEKKIRNLGGLGDYLRLLAHLPSFLMRLVLAAKPLPRLLYFVSSILQMNVAVGLIYVFVIMKKITSSNERYELVPSYFVAVLVLQKKLLICAVFSLFSTKGSFQKEKHQINCGIALFTSSIVICIISATCTIWLATINDNFTMCTYDEGRRACQCKLNMTGIGIAEQNSSMIETLMKCLTLTLGER